MSPDREAAAGLVEYYNSVAKTGVLITYTAQINAKPTADLIATLLSELESAETRATNAEAARNMLAAKRDAAEARALKAEKERDEALERAHYADGIAELAMKHRNAAEALVAEAVRVCEPISALATAHFLRYETTPGVFREAHQGDPDDKPVYGINSTYLLTGHLRAARAFIEKAKS